MTANHRLPPVCILAGGLGTRLGSITQGVPKPLIEVAGEPFLIHQLRLLARHGAQEVVLCVGHLGELIEKRITGDAEGLRIRYSYDAPGLDGTLGAIRRAAGMLGERFLVLYGDTYLEIDYRAVADDWIKSGTLATMTVLHNANRWQPSNAIFRDGMVVCYDKFHPTLEMEWIDYGLGGLTSKALERSNPRETDLATLYSELATTHQLRGYVAENPFHEIGTPERLLETEEFLRSLPLP